jgi:acetylornithine deacetylase
LAISPRLSLLLPTGDAVQDRGMGGVGLQTNLPISFAINKKIVTHWNVGATWIPRAQNVFHRRATSLASKTPCLRVSVVEPEMLYPCEMDVFALTRKLIDIESTTGMEGAVGEALASELTQLGYNVERMPVEGDRFNVWATQPDCPNPELALSTHMDTVPPFIPSSETADRIYGRGSCDAKGIIVAQIAAAEKLKGEGIHVGLLFLVGEERDSQGAQTANAQPRGTRFLVNGEPTENRLALASKGTLRVELVATGRMAHSAYPELGESAIEKLLDALVEIRRLELPTNPKAGPCTMNIGLIEGGRAPNVIPDRRRRQSRSSLPA